jgi:hypothetical protein
VPTTRSVRPERADAVEELEEWLRHIAGFEQPGYFPRFFGCLVFVGWELRFTA